MNMFCFLGGHFRAMTGLAVAVDCFIKTPSGLRPDLVFQLPSDLRSYGANDMPSALGSVYTELRGQSHLRTESPAPSPYYP